jgi:hypothetical protein
MAYTLIGGTAVGTVLILLFLPALYAAWFRIKPAPDDIHEDSTEQPEVGTATAAEHGSGVGGDGSSSRPLALPEHTKGQPHALPSWAKA